jgi:4-hydroxybenzoate polyprenyltransferase
MLAPQHSRSAPLTVGEANMRGGSAARAEDPCPAIPSVAVHRYLSCIRYREILVLQGSPLLGAGFAIGRVSADALGALLIFAAASVLLVAHIFVLNDWAGADDDLNDPNRVAGVFATKGISRKAIRRLWIGLLLPSLALFGLLGERPLVIAMAIATLSFFYSRPRSPAKGIPVLGSALHLGGGILHFLLGFSLFRAIDGRGVALALFFGLAFAAGHLNQEVRDFDGDVRNEIKTNAVSFGKKPTFIAGLVVFTLSYAQLVVLATRGIIPGWLASLALFYLLHLYWSLKTVTAGLTFESVRWFQARYRAIYALIGVAMLTALLTSPSPSSRMSMVSGTPRRNASECTSAVLSCAGAGRSGLRFGARMIGSRRSSRSAAVERYPVRF